MARETGAGEVAGVWRCTASEDKTNPGTAAEPQHAGREQMD